MQKNQEFETEIIDLSYEGMGVAKIDNYPLFIENALPGEVVKISVTKTGKNFGFARVLEWLKKSPAREEAVNLDYLRTGIADLAHLSYDEQLLFKQKQVQNSLSKIVTLREVTVLPTLASENKLHYRNKAQIPVRNIKGQLETGFFRKHSHDLVPIEDFYIQHPEIDALILEVRNLLRQYSIEPYDEKTNRGFLQNLLIRRAHKTGEMMLVMVVKKALHPSMTKEIIVQLVQKFPQLKSIQYSIKHDRGNAFLGKEFQLLYGEDFITDELLGKKFKISAQSFYQVNSEQAEKLYQKAYDYAELKPDDVVIDAYSGIGTIGLCVANQVKQVYGMEVIEQAVQNAKENAKLNEITNAHYEVGKAEEVFPKWQAAGIKPDVILVDPPRKGLEESFIIAACEVKPRVISYISCNPATFARDAKIFQDQGYELQEVQPVDLFPQTHHVECVGMLIRAER